MTKRENDAIWTAAEKANRQCGQWMPQRWIEIFIKELASVPPATPAALGADEIARSMRGYLDKLEYQPTGRDPKNTGFSYAKIPDWQLRQWLEKIERRPLGEVLIDCLKKIGVDE